VVNNPQEHPKPHLFHLATQKSIVYPSPDRPFNGLTPWPIPSRNEVWDIVTGEEWEEVSVNESPLEPGRSVKVIVYAAGPDVHQETEEPGLEHGSWELVSFGKTAFPYTPKH